MSLIFAIDNDKRHSAQLASLLRAQVDADLVQSASASEGLAILQGRVPDLILTSTFLSPRDEAALASYLRDLGGRGAHVQTLTIPMLAADPAAAKGKKKAGMLGALRRGKTVSSVPEGCSPDAFAREVQQYLARALERRASETAAKDVLSLPYRPLQEPGPASEPEPMQATDVAATFDSNVVAADSAPVATGIPLIVLAPPVVEVVTPSILLVAPLAESGDAASAESAPLESSSFLLADPAPAPAPEPSGWTLVTPPTAEAVIAPLIIKTVEARAPVSFVVEAVPRQAAAAKAAAREAAARKAAAREAAAAEAAARKAAAAEAAAREAAAREAAAAEAAAREAAACEAAAREAAAREAAAAKAAAREAAAAEAAARKAAAAEAAAREAAAREAAAAEAAAREAAAAEAAREAAAAEAAAREAAAREAAAREAAAAEAAAREAAAAEAAREAAAAEAAAREAAAREAAAREAAAREAAAREAAAREAAAREAAAREAAAREAAAREAAAREAAAREAAAAEAAAREAAAREAAAREAAAAETAAREAAAAEAAAREAAAAEAAAREAAAAEAAAREAAAAEAAAREAAAAEAAAREAAAAEAAAREAAAAEAAAREAAAAEAAAREAAAAEAAAREAAAAEAAAREAAAAEAAASEAAAAEVAAAPQTSGFGDIYMDTPDSVAETVVDLSQAAVAAGAHPAEGDVPVVDMAKPDDLDALSRQLADAQSLFVPEPNVPEIPAAVFLKDMPPLDPSIFVDAPAPRPATPLVDQPYAGLAFEDIFLSAKDRKRVVAGATAPEQTAAFDAAPAPEPAVVDPVTIDAATVEAAESIETVTPAAAECVSAEPPTEAAPGAGEHMALESAWRQLTRALEPPVSLHTFASPAAPPTGDTVASNRIGEPEAQAAPEADTRFSLIEAETPMADTPTAGTPATAPVEAESMRRAWSWMERESSTPLADILAAVAQDSEQTVVADRVAAAPAVVEAVAAPVIVEESIAEEIAEEIVADDTVAAGEAPVAEVIAALVVHEVFNADAAASWNAVTALGAAPAEEEESPTEPVTIEEVAAAHAPLVNDSPAVNGSPMVSGVIEVHDPVRAAAWRSAMAGHVADVPSPAAVAVPAPVAMDPEPDAPPAVDEWGGRTGPVLGEEFLALIGNAAHQASLDAFDALDHASTPERATEERERPRLRSSARGNRPAPSRKERRKKPRPAQDEWGMFDPTQCGPDALFDEDAWEDEPDGRRPSPRGRPAA